MSSQTGLTRAKEGRMIGGVCAGIAKQYNLDVTLVRLGAVLLAVFAQVGILLYVVLWAVTPEEESGSTGFDQAKSYFGSNSQTTEPRFEPYVPGKGGYTRVDQPDVPTPSAPDVTPPSARADDAAEAAAQDAAEVADDEPTGHVSSAHVDDAAATEESGPDLPPVQDAGADFPAHDVEYGPTEDSWVDPDQPNTASGQDAPPNPKL